MSPQRPHKPPRRRRCRRHSQDLHPLPRIAPQKHQKNSAFSNLTDPPPPPPPTTTPILTISTPATPYHPDSTLHPPNSPDQHLRGPSYTSMVTSPTFSPPPIRLAKAGKPLLKAPPLPLQGTTDLYQSREKIARLQKIQAEIGECKARIKALEVEAGIVKAGMSPSSRVLAGRLKGGGVVGEKWGGR
ncbi:hypothetical protein K440DRAFT_661536 [Wilcoxina mikolae CBS 423.85]|nr:hypothetical protein K440DRAFT_661536 [Wilcoxina mikolae CBS 423.85]